MEYGPWMWLAQGLWLVFSLIVFAKLILEQTNYHLMNTNFHEVSLIISHWSAKAIRDNRLRVMVFSRSQHNATEMNYNQLYKCALISPPKVLWYHYFSKQSQDKLSSSIFPVIYIVRPHPACVRRFPSPRCAIHSVWSCLNSWLSLPFVKTSPRHAI